MSTNLLERAVGGRALSPKAAVALALALVFLCGAVVGALAMDLGIRTRQRAASFDSLQGKTAYFEQMQRELDLTPAQAAQMESILNDFWQYYRTVLSDSKQRIEQVLNPEQKAKFERILQEQKK